MGSQHANLRKRTLTQGSSALLHPVGGRVGSVKLALFARQDERDAFVVTPSKLDLGTAGVADCFESVELGPKSFVIVAHMNGEAAFCALQGVLD
jgi:hypothetical protein